jgi:hypothetical protein
MAEDQLNDEGIRALITADDAGGMHPHMQSSRGVKLRVLAHQAEAAHAVLADAGLLPDDARADGAKDEAAPEDFPIALANMPPVTTITAYLMVFGLILLAITAGLLC